MRINKSHRDVLQGMTTRQWKSLKRKQLREVKRAFDEYRLGCIFCPGFHLHIAPMKEHIEGLINSHSVRNWGR